MNHAFGRNEVWPEEREGYEHPTSAAYPPLDAPPSPRPLVPVWLEVRLASLMAGAGVVWGIQVLTTPIARVSKLTGTPGPLEVCGISILIWLHAKWRASLNH